MANLRVGLAVEVRPLEFLETPEQLRGLKGVITDINPDREKFPITVRLNILPSSFSGCVFAFNASELAAVSV